VSAIRVQPGRVMIVLTDVTAEHRLAEREHRIALELQRSMLGRIDRIAAVPIGVSYRPAQVGQQVGGDWYDVIALPGDRVGLIVGDVAGHDLRATAAMGQLRSSLRAVAPFCPDAAELVDQADRFAAEIDGADYASMAYVVFDPRDGVLHYACAGHPPPLLVRGYGSADFLEAGRGPLLGGESRAPRRSARACLAPGDALVLYTDGLYERRDDPADPRARLQDIAARSHHLPAEVFADQLVRDMLAGDRAADDICVLVIRREPDARAGEPEPQPPGVAAPAS
jgi:serine phosphatase RsbU (regulator of sigma subunit)